MLFSPYRSATHSSAAFSPHSMHKVSFPPVTKILKYWKTSFKTWKKTKIMAQRSNNPPPVLKKVYQLVGVQLVMAALAMAVIFQHTQQQHEIYDRLGNFHAPSIYYADNLAATLENLIFDLKLNQNSPEKINIRNPSYTIKSQLAAINEIIRQASDPETEKAFQYLQEETQALLKLLQNTDASQHFDNTQLIEALTATRFRATQLSRLHSNLSEQLRELLEQLDRKNTALLINLAVAALLAGGLLLAPLVMIIRRMVKVMEASETSERQLREAAEREKNQMTALLSAMNIGVLFEDKTGLVDFVNPAFLRIWGINADAPISGNPLRNLLEYSPSRFSWPEHASKFVLQVLDTHEISERFEIEFNDGRILTQLSFPVLSDEKGLMGRLWIYEDITLERQTAQQLLYVAEHDPLTGLYNRHRFQKQLDYMLKSAMRNNGRFALLYFDLDEFKYINDNFGHSAGDTVLLRTASEISALVRDVEMFARLGGDEFAILVSLKDGQNLSALPVRIIETIASVPFRLRGSNLRLTASVGVALYPDHAIDAEDLVAHADAAMYHAKRLGKNTWSLYSPEADQSGSMVERMSWSRRIGLALEQNLLELYFQGIYRTDGGGLSHLEVLARIHDPADRSRLIMPGLFIPFAEKTGQIIEIDHRILELSMALLARYPTLPPLAVNISGRSFDDHTLPDFIKNRLMHYRIEPKRLIIELTETEAVSDLGDAQRFIEAISQAGCRVCLDDFGSGFSTFTYLKYLNVDILKIDGLFVRDLKNNRENQLFVQAMATIAQGLHKLIIAEYVENGETLELLQKFGVDFAQGFYLDHPTSQSDMLHKLKI
ncbi:MAG: hypothetical protein CTY18_10990 [Methylomonas sp.]|nr:MAG: hypothetical protein CTY18_10990 [Methylomonas sp.]